MREFLTAEEWAEYLEESYEYYRERDEFCSLYIHVRGTTGGVDDPYLREVINIFQHLGFKSDLSDTWMFDFNLDNNWCVFYCPKCIRDYAYAVPYTESLYEIKELARFIELFYTNKIVVFVKAAN